MAKPKASSFYSIVTAAIADITEHGFDTEGRFQDWMERIRDAAEALLGPPRLMEKQLKDGLRSVYGRLIENGEIARYHPGVSRFTVKNLKPKLRAELDRRILASSNLIVLNRDQAISNTLKRFAGWATSIPKGGSGAVKKSATGQDIRKALTQLPFEERRVLIDQGHKLTASLSEIIADDGGAIAGRWRSNWRQSGYDYREDHKDRDGLVYALRDCWAIKKGLMKAGPNGFYDMITAAATEPFCRCYIQWIYSIAELPKDMLTKKGEQALAEARGDGAMRVDADDPEEEFAGIEIDCEHDVRWMSEMSRDGSIFYYDRTLPREIINNNKRLDPVQPLLRHEVPEYRKVRKLTRAFIIDNGRQPNEIERVAIYETAHFDDGIPEERKWIEENGYSWDHWEAWCRGKLAFLERRRIGKPPPDPDVRLTHDRRKLASNV